MTGREDEDSFECGGFECFGTLGGDYATGLSTPFAMPFLLSCRTGVAVEENEATACLQGPQS
jgi:hypothetical protein